VVDDTNIQREKRKADVQNRWYGRRCDWSAHLRGYCPAGGHRQVSFLGRNGISMLEITLVSGLSGAVRRHHFHRLFGT